MTSSASAAEDAAAHHRPDPFRGLLGHQVARGDTDALNEDVRQTPFRRR